MDFMEYFIHVVYVALGIVLVQMIVAYPFMLIFFFVISVYYLFMDWWPSHGWEFIGEINRIYLFDDEEKRRRFVVYITNENNVNKVVQHVSASMVKSLITLHIENTPLQAVNIDGSIINIHSCGPLISHHLSIMARWNDWGGRELWLGILREDWEMMNVIAELIKERKIVRKPYVLLDMDNPDKDVYSRSRNPHLNYIYGQSSQMEMILKIKNREYRDIYVCMHIFEDPTIALNENFWMYGIFGDLRLVQEKKISRGDEVYIRYRKRNSNLFNC